MIKKNSVRISESIRYSTPKLPSPSVPIVISEKNINFLLCLEYIKYTFLSVAVHICWYKNLKNYFIQSQ